MLSKHAQSNNGHSHAPALLVEYVPDALRQEIEFAFDQEGQMTENAERRILEAINANHRELTKAQSDHETRIKLLEESNVRSEKADEVAANERRDTKRLVKGSVIGIAMMLAVTGIMGYYGLKGTPSPAATQEAASDIKALIQEIRQDRQDREDRKAEGVVPAITTSPRGKTRNTTKTPMPKGKSLLIPDGAQITTRDHLPPMLSCNRIPLLEMKVPE